MEMNFCRRCGSKLALAGEGAFRCNNGPSLFANPAPAIGIFFVTPDNHVLLAIRGIEPFKGMFDAIGGFVDMNEALEHTVEREVLEELGLTPDQYDVPQYLCSGSGVYPYDGEERAIVGSLFWSQLKPGALPKPSDDVAAIKYIPLDSIDFRLVGTMDAQTGLRKLQELLLK